MSSSASQVIPAIAVTEMNRAREFYEGMLGLSGGEEKPDAVALLRWIMVAC